MQTSQTTEMVKTAVTMIHHR